MDKNFSKNMDIKSIETYYVIITKLVSDLEELIRFSQKDTSLSTTSPSELSSESPEINQNIDQLKVTQSLYKYNIGEALSHPILIGEIIWDDTIHSLLEEENVNNINSDTALTSSSLLDTSREISGFTTVPNVITDRKDTPEETSGFITVPNVITDRKDTAGGNLHGFTVKRSAISDRKDTPGETPGFTTVLNVITDHKNTDYERSLFKKHINSVLPSLISKNADNRVIPIPSYATLGEIVSRWVHKLYLIFDSIHLYLEQIRRSLALFNKSDRNSTLLKILCSYFREEHPDKLPVIESNAQAKYIELVYKSYCSIHMHRSIVNNNKNIHNIIPDNLFIVDNLIHLICTSISDLTVVRYKLRYDTNVEDSFTGELSFGIWGEYSKMLHKLLSSNDFVPLPKKLYIRDSELKYDIILSHSLLNKCENYKLQGISFKKQVLIYLCGNAYFNLSYCKCILQKYRNDTTAYNESTDDDWIFLDLVLDRSYYHLHTLCICILNSKIQMYRCATNWINSYNTFVSIYEK